MEGLISNIQAYSTKDGPGIRTTVFLIGCNLRCRWCANPEAMLPGKKQMHYESLCTGCGQCASMQPQAIQIKQGKAVIDRSRIVDWNALEELCPNSAYQTVGEVLRCDECVARCIRDRIFYETSGGGVTFCGGEPCLQSDFVEACSRQLKQAGIHVALDTAGMVPWDILDRLSDVVDLILYDIKAYDTTMHRACTGQDNTLILENAKRLAAKGVPMMVRLVVVPGYNDDIDDLRKRLCFVKGLGKAVQRVDLLPYHRLGEGKYHCLGIPYDIDVPIVDQAMKQMWQALADEVGLEVRIEE